jgi:hypothetical protein
MSRYSWKITFDTFAEPGSHVQIIGPRDASHDWKNDPKPDASEQFRMYDDDGELYYAGRIVGDYDGFEPLDDFGTPNAGCTRIDFKHPKTGEWVAL